MKHSPLFTLITVVLSAPAAHAQLQIDWYTIDSGGGSASGGTFSLTGTIGQPDAGTALGGSFECSGGFWGGGSTSAPSCYANCDGSSIAPVLNALDFSCFLTRFAANDSYANCDNSTVAPTLNALDFSCFLSKFAAGCP